MSNDSRVGEENFSCIFAEEVLKIGKFPKERGGAKILKYLG